MFFAVKICLFLWFKLKGSVALIKLLFHISDCCGRWFPAYHAFFSESSVFIFLARLLLICNPFGNIFCMPTFLAPGAGAAWQLNCGREAKAFG